MTIKEAKDQASEELTTGNYTPDFKFLDKVVDRAMEIYAEAKAIEFMNKRNPLTGVTYLTFNPETREPIWLSQNNDHNITIRLTTEQLYKEFNK